MRTGAFLMIDALGFKGIWKRPGVVDHPEVVIEKLAKLEREATRYLDTQCGGSKGRAAMAMDRDTAFESLEVRFLSDTIVLAIAIKDLKKTALSDKQMTAPAYALGAKVVAVSLMCSLASDILAMAARTDPPLAYRGCIAFGDFEVRDNFLVGPAVDEAAAASDLAQGAFVWLLPSALDGFMAAADEMASRFERVAPYSSWEVPLKGGDVYVTYAVSPLASASTEAERDEVYSRIMGTFTGELDVQVKMQNTFRFLDGCVAEWKASTAQTREERRG